MSLVRAKKNLGQHFLTDQNIARKIVDSLENKEGADVLEIGPGMGVLTQYLLQKPDFTTHVVEIDTESVVYLQEHYPELSPRIISQDFLRMRLSDYFPERFCVIGNFPYNISSQIFFKVLDYRDQVPEVVGMIQKEVAERLATGPGSKAYGILSVILQAFYDIEYLFTVHENVFNPPPKVKSAVIRLVRNSRAKLDCDEKLFIQVVKMAFNQRRKTMRNSLRSFITSEEMKSMEVFNLRPEQMSVADFEQLTLMIEKNQSE
ncbi:MAG: 16S rRNA (adenine(1518)-N(6)/adenine(1519)-N(6))-dimethyltransferase RsmA [Mangrovibacterium sp.]